MMNITSFTYEDHFPGLRGNIIFESRCVNENREEKIDAMFSKNFLMKLRIAPNRLISDVQRDFNNAFPFLKIEFFKNRNLQPAFTFQQMLPHNKQLAEGQTNITDGDIEISSATTVKDLEKIFREQFSLAVQVFRRSGNLWLETTMTDGWTLGLQNQHGQEISTSNKKDNPEDNDYELNRDADH